LRSAGLPGQLIAGRDCMQIAQLGAPHAQGLRSRWSRIAAVHGR
jgi:hypothetical protein